MKLILAVAMEVALTDKQKLVVELYYIQGKKTTQIAEELGVQRRAVNYMLKRAVDRLNRTRGL